VKFHQIYVVISSLLKWSSP